MMDQAYFTPLLDAAELLGNVKTREALLNMQSVYDQKLYFVAFIGQYSAGKSCLLNSLFGRKLLPEGTTETTPLLTYIRYGEREEAKLHYMDGAVQILDLEQVLQLTQRREGGRWDLERLEFLEVYLREDMLRSGMILLDTPGINTLLERHERLLGYSLSIASSIVYVVGRAPTCVDEDKLSMLTEAGFDVIYVRTHCDEIKIQEETLDQVRASDQPILEKCGIGSKRRYYVSNQEESPLFAEIEPLRDMLREKGRRAGSDLESDMERQLRVQAGKCRTALEKRHRLLEQAHAENAEALNKQQAGLLKKIKGLELRLEENEAAMRKRIESCRRMLQGDVKQQLESAIRRSGERIEASAVEDEQEMTVLLRQESADFSRKAYQLVNASLDPLVREVNGEFTADEIEVESFVLPQADNYQELCVDQDELTAQLQDQLRVLQENQADLERALSEKVESPEYIQLQQELQELQEILVEINQERADLPPYVPQMIVEEGKMQPSQIARSIGAAADWAMLLIPGAQVEAALGKLSKVPKVAKTMGKFVGILEKGGKIIKHGDTVKDILFALKNLGQHTRTSKRREKIAGEALAKAAKGAGTGVDVLRNARQNSDAGSILDLLTFEHWAGKLGEQFDHPPRLVVDKEYEAQYREEKDKLEAVCRETQQRAYQKKVKMGLFQKEEERLRAEEESLRIDQEAIAEQLAKREAEMRAAARGKALKTWRGDCAVWYQKEAKSHLHDMLSSYTQEFPVRLEQYQRQRMQALRDALEKEQASYDELKTAPEDEIALELQRVKDLLERINYVY